MVAGDISTRRRQSCLPLGLLAAIVSRQRRRFAAGPTRVSSAVTTDFLDGQLSSMSLKADIALPDFDKWVTLGAALIVIKAREIALQDKFSIAKISSIAATTEKAINDQASLFIKDYEELISQAREAFLIRIKVSAILALTKISE